MYTLELFEPQTVSQENGSEPVALLQDAQLVENARFGDREAFGELVRRHRERALGWASTITQDGYMAEDVVQEALLSAFLHIEKLLEPERFKYWLQRIVRNQAMMKLRRGGPSGKESSFSALEVIVGRPTLQAECSDLDRLLFRLANRVDEERFANQDPQLIPQPQCEPVRQCLQC